MSTIEELLGFNPPKTTPLPDDLTIPFINAVRGKTFGADFATLVSRFGYTDYDDHPLQKLEFSADGKRLSSYCPGPDGSDASVGGPFLLKNIDTDNNYVIELQYGCKTTFLLKGIAINVKVKASDPSTPKPISNTKFLPMMITCQRSGCLQRQGMRFSIGCHDVVKPVIQLKRCIRCKQVHYCSVACQRVDWRERHRVECNSFGKSSPPKVDITSANTADLKALLVYFFQECITGGEERAWRPEYLDQAKEVGRRLFVIGGKILCTSVLEDLRYEFRHDNDRYSDMKLLEIIWSDPVIPGWYA